MLPDDGRTVNATTSARPAAADRGHPAELNAARKRSRNALIFQRGAAGDGSTPLCQCHAEIARKTDGSFEMMLIGTS